MAFQDLGFLERHETSTKISYKIMESLFEKKCITAFYKADKKTDIEGTDYFVIFNKHEPIKKVQFKNRQDKWKDIPITRYQPFYGINSDQTVLGRDYRSLFDKKNDYYIVATQNSSKSYDQISITSTSKILQLMLEAENEWFSNGIAYEYFNQEYFNKFLSQNIRNKKIHVATNGVEAWYKKNFNENYGKINLYVPYRYVDKVITLL